MIQYFYKGAEYTTRARLEDKYDLAHTTLQVILEDKQLEKLVEGNKFYFLKVQVEHAIEMHIQQQLVAKAGKKKHLLPVPKFECLSFCKHSPEG
jgi:hypothetical protein